MDPVSIVINIYLTIKIPIIFINDNMITVDLRILCEYNNCDKLICLVPVMTENTIYIQNTNAKVNNNPLNNSNYHDNSCHQYQKSYVTISKELCKVH